jgi:hypothetical protein
MTPDPKAILEEWKDESRDPKVSALIEALQVAMDALQKDRGTTINPHNAMKLYWRMTVRHLEAVEAIEAILAARNQKQEP